MVEEEEIPPRLSSVNTVAWMRVLERAFHAWCVFSFKVNIADKNSPS